jgi:hypothetical protein
MDDDMYNWEEEDDEGELHPIELPDVVDDVFLTISHFFIEQDRKEKQVNRAVVEALDDIYEEYEIDNSSISIINYVQRKMGWDMEILLEKYEVEDHLLNKHNIYDDDIWRKVLGTSAMSDFRREVFALSQTYLARAVHEVLGKGQQGKAPMGDPLL